MCGDWIDAPVRCEEEHISAYLGSIRIVLFIFRSQKLAIRTGYVSERIRYVYVSGGVSDTDT